MDVTVQDGGPATRHCAVLSRRTRLSPGGIQHFRYRPAPSLAPLAEIHYPPVASVVLGFRRDDVPHPLNGFGMLIPAVEGFRILGTLFSSSLFPHRAPPGHVTLTSYVGGTRAPELAARSGDELAAITTEDLRVILGIRGEPTFRHHVYYPKAIPQYEVGYGRFKQLMAAVEAKAPGLFLAGHYRDGISLGDSLASGSDAADRIQSLLANLLAGQSQTSGRRPSPTCHRMSDQGVLLVNLGSPRTRPPSAMSAATSANSSWTGGCWTRPGPSAFSSCTD